MHASEFHVSMVEVGENCNATEVEIHETVEKVPMDKQIKERLYQILMKYRRAFADFAGKCNRYT